MTKLLAEITEKDFPDEGILWRGWNDDTLRIIQEKNRPVLLFVADADPFVSPFLREIFKAMPANARLRDLLNDFYLTLGLGPFNAYQSRRFRAFSCVRLLVVAAIANEPAAAMGLGNFRT